MGYNTQETGDQESEFESTYEEELNAIRQYPEELDSVILPHQHLDQFISWCKNTPEIEMEYDADEPEHHTAPFTIYTEDNFTKNRFEFNLIMAYLEASEVYEDYIIATQIGGPLTSYDPETDQMAKDVTVDFRNEADSFSDWAMGLA